MAAKETKIEFHKEGEFPAEKKQTAPNMKLLSRASEWKVSVDLMTSLNYSNTHHTDRQSPRHHVVVRLKKTVFLIKLTVPQEENRLEAYKLKKNRYESLRAKCVENGWMCHVMPIEIGCRGFLGHSVISFLSKIGITGRWLKSVSHHIQATVQHASSWIWSRSKQQANKTRATSRPNRRK